MYRVPPNFNANVGLSTAAVVENVLADYDPISAPRYAVEEVFSTYQLNYKDFQGEHYSTPDPEAAYIDGSNRYCFKFPQSWYNSNLQNKSIGLRGISGGFNSASSFVIRFKDKDTENYNCKVQIKFESCDHIIRILDSLAYEMSDPDAVDVYCYYENNGITIKVYDKSFDEENPQAQFNQLVIENVDPNDPFATQQWNVFNNIIANQNVPADHVWEFVPDDEKRYWTLRFDNVWNRKDLFIHASFASNARNNFLGFLGEFYMKPSKIYEFNFNSIDFQIWTSFDGKNPVFVEGLDLILQLSLMHNDKRVTV